jgi:hypothetical protein
MRVDRPRNQVELEVLCDNCGGTGDIENRPSANRPTACPVCDGHGVMIVDAVIDPFGFRMSRALKMDPWKNRDRSDRALKDIEVEVLGIRKRPKKAMHTGSTHRITLTRRWLSVAADGGSASGERCEVVEACIVSQKAADLLNACEDRGPGSQGPYDAESNWRIVKVERLAPGKE